MKNLLMTITIVWMAGTMWAGTYSGGAGTQAIPYQISTVTDWQELIDTPDDWGWDKHFVLTENINFNGATITPVGSFYGVFDGGGKKLQNFIINQPDSDYIGLFRSVGRKIHNLGVENINVIGRAYVGGLTGINYYGTITSCYATGAVSGTGNNVGGLVGLNPSTITDCYAGVDVTGFGGSGFGGLVGVNSFGNIDSCYATGDVSGDLYVGGLVGESTGTNATVDSCHAKGTVTGNQYVGGLVGTNSNEATITSSYAAGEVSGYQLVGGLVGNNYIHSSSGQPTITLSYATGAVIGTNSIGGLAGQNWGVITFCYATGSIVDKVYTAGGGLVGANYGDVVSCYATGAVIGTYSIGGLVGYKSSSATITSCYFLDTSGPNNGLGQPLTDSQMRWQSSFPAWNFVDTWVMRDGLSYPHLGFLLDFLEGQGSEEHPYKLNSGNDLLFVGNHNVFWDKHFKLMKDLDLSGLELRPIGNGEMINGMLNSFTGTFDGNRHVLRNLRIVWPEDEPNHVGLFGYISGASAEVKQLGLENVRIGTSSNRAGNNVGGLAGTLADGARITECYVSDGDALSRTVRVYGHTNVGGLVGLIEGASQVKYCYTRYANYAGGSADRVIGTTNVGGLVGQVSSSSGKIFCCYSKGSTASNVQATSPKGWIAGSANTNSIEACYWNILIRQ